MIGLIVGKVIVDDHATEGLSHVFLIEVYLSFSSRLRKRFTQLYPSMLGQYDS
jgi:hypothetical protein